MKRFCVSVIPTHTDMIQDLTSDQDIPKKKDGQAYWNRKAVKS